MGEKVVAVPPSMVTAWMAVPPAFGGGVSLIDQVLDSLLTEIAGRNIDIIETDEPRRYRTTASGRGKLSEAIREKCVGQVRGGLEIVSSDFECSIDLFGIGDDRLANGVGIRTRSDVFNVVNFIKKWFVDLGCVSAWVSRDYPEGDLPRITGYEYRHRPHRLAPLWHNYNLYTRGAFWGNALGEELCERLGGRRFVLENAPVEHREPLGEGVWLQTSQHLPSTSSQLADLESFLAVLLDWRAAQNLRETEINRIKDYNIEPAILRKSTSRAASRAEVPVKWVVYPPQESTWVINLKINKDVLWNIDFISNQISDIMNLWHSMFYTQLYGTVFEREIRVCPSGCTFVVGGCDESALKGLKDICENTNMIDEIIIGTETIQ